MGQTPALCSLASQTLHLELPLGPPTLCPSHPLPGLFRSSFASCCAYPLVPLPPQMPALRESSLTAPSSPRILIVLSTKPPYTEKPCRWRYNTSVIMAPLASKLPSVLRVTFNSSCHHFLHIVPCVPLIPYLALQMPRAPARLT